MPIQARRVFRLSLTTALALAAGYGLDVPLPFMAPLFAFLLTAKPGPPLGLKGLIGLSVLVSITLGLGLLLVPVFLNYPVSAILMVGVGLFFCNYLTVNLGKGLVGTFLTVGITMIPAAGLLSFTAALTVVEALLTGITIAIVCQLLVYPLFPEPANAPAAPKPPATDAEQNSWLALRATIIVLPPFFLALTNPGAYMPLIIKSVSLGQQASVIDAHHAGRELLGSTFLGGCFAILAWLTLGMMTSLWMFFLVILLLSIYFSCKLYRLYPSRFPGSFWQNVIVTMLILLGSAVQDSLSGKDVYKAFVVRMTLFIAVTFYAWAAIWVMEQWRVRRVARARQSGGKPISRQPATEAS